PYFVLVDGPSGRVQGEGTGTNWPQVWNLLRQAADDSNEHLIDRELLTNGVAPGDPSLYRTAEEIAQQTEGISRWAASDACWRALPRRAAPGRPEESRCLRASTRSASGPATNT